MEINLGCNRRLLIYMRAVNFDIALYILILQSQTIHELKERIN